MLAALKLRVVVMATEVDKASEFFILFSSGLLPFILNS
jgi:hypothetical protein